MKYLKRFEKYESKFKIGDKVVANYSNYDNFKSLSDFLNDNVGVISGVHSKHTFDLYYFNIKYDNIPDELMFFTKDMDGKTYIVHEKELRLATDEEIEIQKLKPYTNKYNL